MLVYFVASSWEYIVISNFPSKNGSIFAIFQEKNFRRCNSNDPNRSNHSSASRGSEESHHAGRDVVMRYLSF